MMSQQQDKSMAAMDMTNCKHCPPEAQSQPQKSGCGDALCQALCKSAASSVSVVPVLQEQTPVYTQVAGYHIFDLALPPQFLSGIPDRPPKALS